MRIRIRVITVLLPVLIIFAGCKSSEEEEIVHIPEKAFLDALVANGVDLNGDGLISYSEAEASTSLVIPPSGISDLTGLEAFVNLESLTITLNPLDGIDLLANSSLKYLDITHCELSELELGGNQELETLICGRNDLTELDLSDNRDLKTLVVNNNQLTSLDLSPILSLNTMISCGNSLGYLDISMHPELTRIGVDNMPMLTKVCVWSLPFPPQGIILLDEYSPNIQYTTDCSR